MLCKGHSSGISEAWGLYNPRRRGLNILYLNLESTEGLGMISKGYLLATASGVAAAAAAGGAQAADMPVKAPVMQPPVASWAGWYIGLNAGANWQSSSNSFGYAGGDLPVTSVHTRSTGFIGGGQIGYNWQAGTFVYGLEGDISGLGGSSNANIGTPFGGGKAISNRITWLSTVRGRAGLLIDPTTLAYVTGGLAVGGVKNSFTGTPGFIGFNKSVSTTRVGWTIGGGVEHMLFDSHWTIGLEGLFVDLGKSSATATAGLGPGAPPGGKTAHFSNQAAIGRVKLNYKF
jgi:outer membrane immunogenic protein